MVCHDGDVDEVFRPWFGRALTVVITAICAAVLAATARSGLQATLQAAPWLGLVALACWAAFWRPRVVVNDAVIRLVNVTRTIEVPWPALREVETRFALTLVTAYGRYTAWAAPAPGARTAVQSIGDRPTAGRPDGRPVSAADTQRLGDLPDSPSGDAATMVRRRWAHLREAGFLDDPRLELAAAPVHWHVRLLVAALALCVAGVAGFLLDPSSPASP